MGRISLRDETLAISEEKEASRLTCISAYGIRGKLASWVVSSSTASMGMDG
jgi:hypothetical protein